MRRISMMAIACLVVAACGQSGSPDPDVTTSAADPGTSTTATTLRLSGEGETDVVLAAAVDDLLTRVDAGRDEIEVVSVSGGQWNDGALGCPEEGFSYTQALVNGYRIELMVNGTLFVYAQGGDTPVFFCEQPNEDAFKTDFTIPGPSIPPPID